MLSPARHPTGRARFCWRTAISFVRIAGGQRPADHRFTNPEPFRGPFRTVRFNQPLPTRFEQAPVLVQSHGAEHVDIVRRGPVETVKFEEASGAVRRATGVTLGKRQVEQLAARRLHEEVRVLVSQAR